MQQLELITAITDKETENLTQDLDTTFDVSPELRSLTESKDFHGIKAHLNNLIAKEKGVTPIQEKQQSKQKTDWYAPINKATELLQKHKVNAPPIDVLELALQEGMDINFAELEKGISGKYKGQQIVVNKAHGPNRRRFTIAHELGHSLLHKRARKGEVDIALFRQDDNTKTSKEEAEANRFAGQLLMPKNLIEEAIGNRPVTEEILEELADTFKVSVPAISFRLQNIGRFSQPEIANETVTKQSSKEKTQLNSEIEAYHNQKINIECNYYISFGTKFQKQLLKGAVKTELQTMLTDSITECGHKLFWLNISDTKVDMLIEISPSAQLTEFIEGLKTLSSSTLRNKFSDIATLTPQVWAEDYSIYTVGALARQSVNSENLVLTTT